MRFISKPCEKELQKVSDALLYWNDPKEVRRVRAISMSIKGVTVPQIAEALDVSRWSVRQWFDRYERDGLSGLRTELRPGRPRKADDEYMEILEKTVGKAPRKLGYPFSSWTMEYLCRHMKQETGVDISVSRMSSLLKELDFTYKRARHDLSQQRDPELYEEKKSELIVLKKKARSEKPDFDLVFVDEAEVHLNPPLTRVWAKIGEPAPVPAAGRDQKAVVMGAWDFRTEDFIWHISDHKNTDAFLELLEKISAKKQRADR